jgi:hypothetical protein
MKRMNFAACIILCALLSARSQQAPTASHYLKQADVIETDGTVRIVANSPRPLEQALDALYQKYKWSVAYEDPQFISKLDKVAEGTEHKLLPSGGQFNVEFPANAEEQKILQTLVDFYNASTNPGRFELRKSEDGIFFVVGTQARNLRGELVRQRALLDVPISLPVEERTAAKTLVLICQKLAAQKKIPVTMGVTPRSILSFAKVKVGGSRVSARNLLLQVLASTHRHLYWRLLYDPNTKGYLLNVHSAAS